jgi:dCTP deaminase
VSVLSNYHIYDAVRSQDIKILPFDPHSIQPASYDVHLGDSFIVYGNIFSDDYPVDPLRNIPTGKHLEPVDTVVIKSKEFMLATTLEVLGLDNQHVARVEGVSSLGRLGLAVHTTAGYIDPGFQGQVTLELFNMAPYALRLTAGMRIAQIAFERTTGPSKGYKGRYQSQFGVTKSRYNSADRLAKNDIEPKAEYL